MVLQIDCSIQSFYQSRLINLKKCEHRNSMFAIKIKFYNPKVIADQLITEVFLESQIQAESKSQ